MTCPFPRSISVPVRSVVAIMLAFGTAGGDHTLEAQDAGNAVRISEPSSDSVSIRLIDAELKTAIIALARYLDRPVLIGAGITGRVTLETPQPVPRSAVTRLLRGVVEGQGFSFVSDTSAGAYRVQVREPQAREMDRPLVIGATGISPVTRPVSEMPELFVVRLRHARAADVAATVNALYGRASAFGEIGARARGAGPTLRQQLAPDPNPLSRAPLPSSPSPVASATAGRSAQFAGEVTIVPDANSNILLVRASRNDYELVNVAVRQLDVRPLQALIEVIIAEIRTDKSLSFGVEAQLTPDRPSANGNRTTASQTGIGLGDFAMRVMRVGSGVDLEATLRASAARGDARIVSRPIVLAANGETAEILVGSQRPFVQVQRSLPTDTPTRDQVIQYKDVGTRLSVRPTISGDGYLSLAVTQEVNAATAETQFDAPVISTRTVQTILLVRDSQVVVLGGLTDVQKENSQSGVPFLSSIPWIGGLFGRASRRSTETEFFLFIRPRILRTDEDAEALTKPYEERAKRAGDSGPLGKTPPQ